MSRGTVKGGCDAALPHVTAGENDRDRPLYSARLGVGTRSVHKYRVQRRHQQFIAIISGVLTALSATPVLGGWLQRGRVGKWCGVAWQRERETENRLLEHDCATTRTSNLHD